MFFFRTFILSLCFKRTNVINRFSPTYAAILDLLFRTNTVDSSMYSNEFDISGFKRIKLNDVKTKRLPQEITITVTELFDKCSSAQWYLVGLISSQLKLYNALWECPEGIKRSSSNKIAIKGLIEMKILIKTETPHIYLVNPFYIRRGGFHEVLVTTAGLLAEAPKVLPEHIINKRVITEFSIPDEYRPQLSYGYAEHDDNIISSN